MNNSQLAIDELYLLIKYAVKQMLIIVKKNMMPSDNDLDEIESHASRILNLVDAIRERINPDE